MEGVLPERCAADARPTAPATAPFPSRQIPPGSSLGSPAQPPPPMMSPFTHPPPTCGFQTCPIPFARLVRHVRATRPDVCESFRASLPPNAPPFLADAIRAEFEFVTLRQFAVELEPGIKADILAAYPDVGSRTLRSMIRSLSKECGDADTKQLFEGALEIALAQLPDLIDEQVARGAPAFVFESVNAFRVSLLGTLYGNHGSRLLVAALRDERPPRRTAAPKALKKDLRAQAHKLGFAWPAAQRELEERKNELLAAGAFPLDEILDTYFALLQPASAFGAAPLQPHSDPDTETTLPVDRDPGACTDVHALTYLLPELETLAGSAKPDAWPCVLAEYLAFWADGARLPASNKVDALPGGSKHTYLVDARDAWRQRRFDTRARAAASDLLALTRRLLAAMADPTPPVPAQFKLFAALERTPGTNPTERASPVDNWADRAFRAWQEHKRAKGLDPIHDPIASILKAGRKERSR